MFVQTVSQKQHLNVVSINSSMVSLKSIVLYPIIEYMSFRINSPQTNKHTPTDTHTHTYVLLLNN